MQVQPLRVGTHTQGQPMQDLVAILRRRNDGLFAKLEAERDRNVKLEAQRNGLVIANRQLQMQHEEDLKQLRIYAIEYERIATRAKMVEGALNTAHRRNTPRGFTLDSDDEQTPQVPLQLDHVRRKE